jgi:hypothetical protein
VYNLVYPVYPVYPAMYTQQTTSTRSAPSDVSSCICLILSQWFKLFAWFVENRRILLSGPLSRDSSPLGTTSVGLNTVGCHQVSLLTLWEADKKSPTPLLLLKRGSMISGIVFSFYFYLIIIEILTVDCRVYVFLCSGCWLTAWFFGLDS